MNGGGNFIGFLLILHEDSQIISFSDSGVKLKIPQRIKRTVCVDLKLAGHAKNTLFLL
jgi:hypothetical protein